VEVERTETLHFWPVFCLFPQLLCLVVLKQEESTKWLVYAFEKNPNKGFGLTRKLPCNAHYHPLGNKQGYCLVLSEHVWIGDAVEDDTKFGQPLFPSISLADKTQLRERNKQVLLRENLGRKRQREGGGLLPLYFRNSIFL
jgi:hypothetical protein